MQKKTTTTTTNKPVYNLINKLSCVYSRVLAINADTRRNHSDNCTWTTRMKGLWCKEICRSGESSKTLDDIYEKVLTVKWTYTFFFFVVVVVFNH